MIDLYENFPRAFDLANIMDFDPLYECFLNAYYKERVKQVMMDIIWANLNGFKKTTVKDINECIADHFIGLGYMIKEIGENTYSISWEYE